MSSQRSCRRELSSSTEVDMPADEREAGDEKRQERPPEIGRCVEEEEGRVLRSRSPV